MDSKKKNFDYCRTWEMKYQQPDTSNRITKTEGKNHSSAYCSEMGIFLMTSGIQRRE